jgi:hypothetical protein
MRILRWGSWLGLVALGLGAPLAYLAAARVAGFSGFPLDDAFIHQTYARNLALTGRWIYSGDLPSAGSTSPLWTLTMAMGQWLKVELPWWPMALGIGFSLLAAWLGSAWGSRALDVPRGVGAVLILGEWHLVWAAVSGMEIPLFMAWLAACWWAVSRIESAASARWRDLLWLGLLASLAPWIRPEAILAIPFIIVGVILARGGRGQRIARGLVAVAPVLISLLLYFTFNRSLGGGIWPNTFYAKQVEYGVLREGGLLQRASVQVAALLAGPLAVLVLGIPISLYTLARERRWVAMLPGGWALLHVAAYTARLPVAYQHGRYLIPILPVALVYGAAGLRAAWQSSARSLLGRVALRAAWTSTAVTSLAFLFLGGRAYVRDVGLIDEEMVASAKWIAANTPAEAVIAAHDIGALGYYAGRRLVDLGGLTDVDALRVLADPSLLPAFLTRAGSDYLVTFPGLYPQIAERCRPIFSTGGAISPSLGGENMAVYRWSGGCASRFAP